MLLEYWGFLLSRDGAVVVVVGMGKVRDLLVKDQNDHMTSSIAKEAP